MKWQRGELVEIDGLLAVVVALPGDQNVPDDHVGVWFGKPDCVRISEGGPGKTSPEIWTVPSALLRNPGTPTWRH